VDRAAAIDGVVERLKARIGTRLRVESLILFGSRVAGAIDQWSDYDFIVVSPDFEGMPFLERGRLLFPLRESGVSYDFLCYTPSEFDRLSSHITFVREAARTGLRVL
jgi:predicted nucleotidyltransferase